MLTVLEAVKLSAEYLDKKGIGESRINAELLLCDILNCKRLDLYLRFEQPLKEEEKDKYREYIARRSKYEPLQYIVGYTEFYGYRFNVNPGVLIPRQETEILIDTVVESLDRENNMRILDIGTGSGNIPITLAKEMTNAAITTIDISEKAIETAKHNAELNQVNGRVEFVHRSLFDGVERLGKFDAIVSNPPYVSSKEYGTLQNEVLLQEPKEALTDDGDGYKFYTKILELKDELLNEGGKLFFEAGDGKAQAVMELMNKHGMKNVSARKDYLDIDRVVYGEK